MRDYPAKKKRVDMAQVRAELVMQRALNKPGHWICFKHHVVTDRQAERLKEIVVKAFDLMDVKYKTFADGIQVLQ